MTAECFWFFDLIYSMYLIWIILYFINFCCHSNLLALADLLWLYWFHSIILLHEWFSAKYRNNAWLPRHVVSWIISIWDDMNEFCFILGWLYEVVSYLPLLSKSLDVCGYFLLFNFAFFQVLCGYVPSLPSHVVICSLPPFPYFVTWVILGEI